MKGEEFKELMPGSDIEKIRTGNNSYTKDDIICLGEYIKQIQKEIQDLEYTLTGLTAANRDILERINKTEGQEDIQWIKQMVTLIYELLKNRETPKESIINPIYPRKIKNQITFRDIQKASTSPLDKGSLKTVDIVLDTSYPTAKSNGTNVDNKRENTDSYTNKENNDVKEAENEKNKENPTKKSGLSFPFFK